MELQPESDAQPAIRPTQLIVHSIVAPWTPRRTYEYWRDSTNLESHFGLGYDGSLAQYIGTETRADANAQANRRPDGTGAVSVETASNTKASDPWTDAQVEALIRLGVWMHQHHGVPLRICRRHDDPGFGYHRLFSQWSVGGTVCPGNARVRQFRDVVFPGIVARATGKTSSTEEDDMPHYLNIGMTKPYELDPRKWLPVAFDTEWSDTAGIATKGGQHVAAGPVDLVGDVNVRVSGLPAGAELQARLVLDTDDGRSDLPWGETPGTAGTTTLNKPITCRLAKGTKARIFICHYGDKPVTVERVELKALVWKR